MKNFSIFEQALKFSGVEQTENLGEIASLARSDFADRESFICHTTTATVEYACLLIENAILLRTNRSGRVYAGVEKLSLLQPIIDRYMRIADVSEAVYLFGQDDWRPPRHPNIRLDHVEQRLSYGAGVVCNYTEPGIELRAHRI